VEEVYVEQPLRFVAPGHEGKVLKLNKALYGLRHGKLLVLGIHRWIAVCARLVSQGALVSMVFTLGV
jgi:hypothetical protein